MSLFEEMIGLPKKRRSLQELLSEFDVSLKQGGLGPVACATLAGDSDLVKTLVSAKASANTRAPAMPEFHNTSGMTPLHIACYFQSQNLQLLKTLLELRADVKSSNAMLAPPLHYCRSTGALQLLLENKAGINDTGKTLARWRPVQVAAGLNAPSEVLASLLELRADITVPVLTHLAYASFCSNSRRSAQLLLDGRADINQRFPVEGLIGLCQSMARLVLRGFKDAPDFLKVVADVDSTPLGFCAMFGNEDLLVVLLAARADPAISNSRNLRPIDLASCEIIRDVLRDPMRHIYLFEHEADLVEESF
ncbi:Ank2 [Symbiodinium sp. CCMP2592]|nr:Ank2 [Symbiodinium sp. CCMP2592]